LRRIRNDRLIRRNSLLGRVLLFGGLGILVAGFLVSLTGPVAFLPFVVVAVASMVISQGGIALMARWGRGPRLDEVIDAGLKGLDDRYTVVHYTLGAPHTLLAPSGVYALVPVVMDGMLRESGGRWTRSLPRRGRLRPARDEAMPDLSRRAQREAAKLRRSLAGRRAGASELTVRPLLLFVSPKAQVEATPEADPPALHIKKLKDWLRHQPRHPSLRAEALSDLASRLGLAPQEP